MVQTLKTSLNHENISMEKLSMVKALLTSLNHEEISKEKLSIAKNSIDEFK